MASEEASIPSPLGKAQTVLSPIYAETVGVTCDRVDVVQVEHPGLILSLVRAAAIRSCAGGLDSACGPT